MVRIINLLITKLALKSLITICITKILPSQEHEMLIYKTEDLPMVRKMQIWVSVKEGITLLLDTQLQLPLEIRRFHQLAIWLHETIASPRFREWDRIRKLLLIKSQDWC